VTKNVPVVERWLLVRVRLYFILLYVITQDFRIFSARITCRSSKAVVKTVESLCFSIFSAGERFYIVP